MPLGEDYERRDALGLAELVAKREVHPSELLEEAVARAERESDEAFVIGGADLYAAALPSADRLVITHVEADVEGDTRFPEVDWSRWRLVSEEAHPTDERHAYPFRVAVYERAGG